MFSGKPFLKNSISALLTCSSVGAFGSKSIPLNASFNAPVRFSAVNGSAFCPASVTTRFFALVLLIGTISGTYSSPFISVPVLRILENRKKRDNRS